MASFINKVKITIEQKEKATKKCIIHLSKLARKILRSLKKQEQIYIDLRVFNAIIDVGLWSDSGNYS